MTDDSLGAALSVTSARRASGQLSVASVNCRCLAHRRDYQPLTRTISPSHRDEIAGIARMAMPKPFTIRGATSPVDHLGQVCGPEGVFLQEGRR